MLFKTYENICKKHNIKPSQVIADKNIAEILTKDQRKHLKINELFLVIIICFLASSLFNSRPLQEVTEQMQDRNQSIQNVNNQI